MNSASGITPYRVMGCPIRRSSAQCLVPAPRCFSQLPTSFVGTRRQGIHRMPHLPSSSTTPLITIPWVGVHPRHLPASGGLPPDPGSHAGVRRHGIVPRPAQHVGTDELGDAVPHSPARVSLGRTHHPGCPERGSSKGLVMMSLQLLRCKTPPANETDHRPYSSGQ